MAWAAYDTETTGLSPYLGDTMFAYSTGRPGGNPQVYRLDGSAARRRSNTDILERFWDNGHEIVMHNAKFDITFTEKHFGKLIQDRPIHDTSVLCRMLRSDFPNYELKYLAWMLADIPTDDQKAVTAYRRAVGSYDKVPEHVMNRYQARDAERTVVLFDFLSQKLAEMPPAMQRLYQWERQLIWTKLRMERLGLRVDSDRALQLADELEQKASDIRQRIDDVAGRPINPSGPDAAVLLFDYLKLPVIARTPNGKPSTEKSVLFALQETHPHPVLELILQYRSYVRGKTTLRSYVDLLDDEGYLHPSVNTYGAPTGRESCSNPNLYNVETTDSLRNPFPVAARTVFVPRPGYVNFYIDEAGIEMRTLLHYSGDEILLAALLAGQDPHLIPAEEIWYRDWWADASPEQRKLWRNAAKNGNFGIHYGAKIPKIAATLMLPIPLVRDRWEEYHRRFPGARRLQRQVQREVEKYGYVTTAFGRRIYVPPHKPYVGVNYKSQGTAADIIKIAQVRVDDYLRRETGGEVRLLLSIYDEIDGECPIGRWNHFRRKELPEVVKLMTEFPEMNVPLAAEASVSVKSWQYSEPVKIGM